ncbi:MAG: hypothetical protein FWC47_02115, partial [Oscillospiraceae bacterium]|nr:hypothetical protein [Oscillospiraceae bacterium]
MQEISNASLNGNFVTDSVIVVLKKSVSEVNKKWQISDFPEADIESIRDQTKIDGDVLNSELNLDNFHQIFLFTLKDKCKEGVLEAVKKLQNNPYIECVDPNYIAYLDQTPNDQFFSNQWALPKIEAPEAWDITVGSTDILVGVIDSGINYSHPDLSGRV